jgi:very-short-patch-repair endonuclease
MKQISATALSKERNIETKELFKILTDKKWIYKKNNSWHLTKEGRMAGGDVKYNPKFGEYIVWPSNIDLNQTTDYKETLTVTKIGEQFDISRQKVNLFLSELGWIEKGKGGWVTTNAGNKNGAIQMEAKNGKPYVVWNQNLLNNKHFNRLISEATGNIDVAIQEEKQINESDDFRKKFPANYRTPDGHYVRSRAEVMIDDFLYKNGIVHAYERKLNIDEDMYCDFYIPSHKLYIEFWGLEENEQYAERKKIKKELYAKYNFKLIEIDNNDIENLDEKLASKLRSHEIIVD